MSIHNHLQIDLAVGLPTPVEIKFRSVSRNDTQAELIHEPSQTWEEHAWTYALYTQQYMSIVHWVQKIYFLTDEKALMIGQAVKKALSKCESRYGNSVQDYEEFDCDCTLTIV